MATDSTPRDIHEREMIERMIDGYKKALSAMKEIQPLQPHERWDLLIPMVEQLIYLSRQILNARGQSRQQLLQGVQNVESSIYRAVHK